MVFFSLGFCNFDYFKNKIRDINNDHSKEIGGVCGVIGVIGVGVQGCTSSVKTSGVL